MIINSTKISEINAKTEDNKKLLRQTMVTLKPYLMKYKANPPKVNEITAKNAKWSCGVQGISIKLQKENSAERKNDNTIIRSIIEASINRKYLLNNDKKNPQRYQEIKDIIESLKKDKIYNPSVKIKNQFKGFKYEAKSKFNTNIKSIHKDAAKILLKLDYDLQPVIKHFDISLKSLHETQSTIKEGHNRNHGQVISVKVLNRSYEQIFYTALHELAHSKHFNHGKEFKDFLGQLIIWCYNNKYPTPAISQHLLQMGLQDIKYRPTIK